MGKVNEDRVYNIIRKKWAKRQISKLFDEYSSYDFYDSKYSYLLKSRKCDHDTYATTLISEMKCNKRIYLLFLFTDGLYYIKYKKDKFKKYNKKCFVKIRDDKKDVCKYYYFIPVEDLKKIEKKNNIIKNDKEIFIVYF